MMGQIDLLDGNGGRAGDGGEKLLELLEPLAVGGGDGGLLQDDAEVLAKAALDGVVEGEIEDGAGVLAGDDRAFIGVLRDLRTVGAAGVIQLDLGGTDGGRIRPGTDTGAAASTAALARGRCGLRVS
jgi:hypothetical protein